MEHNRNSDKPKKPEGDRPKNGYITPLLIALVKGFIMQTKAPFIPFWLVAHKRTDGRKEVTSPVPSEGLGF